MDWWDFQIVRKTEQILTPGHWLHAGMRGIHYNSAFLPSPISQNQISLFPTSGFPRGARSNVFKCISRPNIKVIGSRRGCFDGYIAESFKVKLSASDRGTVNQGETSKRAVEWDGKERQTFKLKEKIMKQFKMAIKKHHCARTIYINYKLHKQTLKVGKRRPTVTHTQLFLAASQAG